MMARHGSAPVEYLSASAAPHAWERALGAAVFGATDAAAAARSACPPDLPVVAVHLPLLAHDGAVIERWRGEGTVRAGRCAGVRYTHTDTLMFGAIEALEPEVVPEGRSGLEQATEQTYRAICRTLDANGFPHLLRVWNYVPDINLETHALERYRQFNSARQRALLACGRDVRGNVPAASALGCASGPLSIYFLAGRDAPRFIENPRQVSAYHYPPQYGARTPSFSRAALCERDGEAMLFISGTSSIVGHRTLHEGDPAAQTRETLTNIEALLGEANRSLGGALKLDSLAYKVYVRDPADLAVIGPQIDAAIGASAARVYLKADICRRDLSVEIEAAGRCRGH